MPLLFRVVRSMLRVAQKVVAWGTLVIVVGLCYPPAMRAVMHAVNEMLLFVFTCDPHFSEQSPAVDASFLDDFTFTILEGVRSVVCFVVRFLPIAAMKSVVYFTAYCLTQTITLELGYLTLMLLSVKIIMRLDAGFHAC